MRKSKDSLRDLWNNQAERHLHYRGPRWTGEREGPENLFEEVMDENFPTWGMKQTPRTRKPREFQGKINSKKLTPRYTIIKAPKVKDREES